MSDDVSTLGWEVESSFVDVLAAVGDTLDEGSLSSTSAPLEHPTANIEIKVKTTASNLTRAFNL